VKWRCTWCGKPHDENEPPCDNCGHNKFEQAVVRADEEPAEDQSGRTVDTGPTYVWACPNCDREHVKNNPPCSRCGNPTLERVEQNYDDVDRDLETPSWIEVAKPYTPAFLLVGVVIALFATGIIPPSVLPGIGAPTPPDAPGESTEASGLDLALTEREIHEYLEAEREASNDLSRSYDDGLAVYAEYANRQSVRSDHTDDEIDGVPHPDEFGVDCGDTLPELLPFTTESIVVDEYDSEEELAADIAEGLLDSESGEAVRSGHETEGIDVHVVDGQLYVMYGFC